jgi:hypothetical protein
VIFGLLAESRRYPNEENSKSKWAGGVYGARAWEKKLLRNGVIRVIARNKKMAPEELSAATRFDDLRMDSLDALNMIFAFNCRRFSS